jgi:hypothetical protein
MSLSLDEESVEILTFRLARAFGISMGEVKEIVVNPPIYLDLRALQGELLSFAKALSAHAEMMGKRAQVSKVIEDTIVRVTQASKTYREESSIRLAGEIRKALEKADLM